MHFYGRCRLGARKVCIFTVGAAALLWIALGCSGLLWAALGLSGLLWAALAALGCSGLLWAALGCSGLLWAALANPWLLFGSLAVSLAGATAQRAAAAAEPAGFPNFPKYEICFANRA